MNFAGVVALYRKEKAMRNKYKEGLRYPQEVKRKLYPSNYPEKGNVFIPPKCKKAREKLSNALGRG